MTATTVFSPVHLKRALLATVGILVAFALALAPLQSDAKPVKKAAKAQSAKAKAGKKGGSKQAIAKSGKKSALAPKASLKANGKAKLGKGMKASFVNGKVKGKGKGKFKKVAYFVPAPPSVGMMSGLHATPDPLALKSAVALVVDANTSQVLLEKNATTALPIASITKLMTALVVMDARLDMNERLTVGEADVQLEKYVRSRLTQGTEMSRRDALLLALMSSENRAANMLTRYYPGGKPAFVDAMNRKAVQLGMRQSGFVEGTGLASANVASAHDLVKLVKAAKQYPLLRELSTQASYTLHDTSGKVTEFRTTNRLVLNPSWDVVLQKTGFINAAGQCLVMDANIDGRSVIMVLLDSAGKLSRLGDAQRVRDWLATTPMSPVAPKATAATPLTAPSASTSHAQQMLAWTAKPAAQPQ